MLNIGLDSVSFIAVLAQISMLNDVDLTYENLLTLLQARTIAEFVEELSTIVDHHDAAPRAASIAPELP